MKSYMAQKLYFGIGVLSLALGFIGIFLPIMPTTPFLLISAWAFQKGSPKLHLWLSSHPMVGPSIVAWQRHGIISNKAKFLSILLIISSFTLVIATRPLSIYIKTIMVTFGVALCIFIKSRPSNPGND